MQPERVAMPPEQAATIAATTAMHGPVAGTVAAGMAVVNTYVNAGGGVQQASFSVDIEQIPGLIEKYQEARAKLTRIKNNAFRLTSALSAPGEDEVSKQMTKELALKGQSDVGCLGHAVDEGIKRLTDQIEQLEAALRDYQNTDESAIARQV